LGTVLCVYGLINLARLPTTKHSTWVHTPGEGEKSGDRFDDLRNHDRRNPAVGAVVMVTNEGSPKGKYQGLRS